ncbi:MAG: tryptophan-rich sensory protein [bacterium]|nr:tryptophan-rich sensory protein [bacterium]
MKKAVQLLIAILIVQGAGIIGSFAIFSAIPTWYAGLVKPAFAPPNWIFGPVWVILYTLIGIAAFLAWRNGWERKEVKVALGVFGLQLVLNAVWPIIFFGLHSLSWAFVNIIALWLVIVWTIVLFYKISKPAACLLLLYILWISFAGYLNYSILVLNQEKSVVCTMDAKLCPDGSYVARIPPKCDFAACQETRAVNLYYYNSKLDKDESGNIACSRDGLAPVERKIPITKTPIQDTIKLLLLGELTDEEQVQGIGTEYHLEGFSLKGASLQDGVLTLEFNDSKNRTVGGACRVGILWFQIEATAKQFPEVQEVRFLPEEIFQP